MLSSWLPKRFQSNNSFKMTQKPRRRVLSRPLLEELESRIAPVTNLYTVPGTPGTLVNIEFNWEFSGAAFDNELAVYRVTDELGSAAGTRPTSPNYESLAVSLSQVVFEKGDGPGKSRTMQFSAGDRLAFVLITNAPRSAWQATNAQNVIGVGPLAYFSVDGPNPSDFDPVLVEDLGNGSMRFFIEDLGPGGDRNFTDMVFTVGLAADQALLAPGIQGQTVRAEFTIEEREAAFKNEFGIFFVDDAQGRISGNFFPGDEGYAEAVFTEAERIVIFDGTEQTGDVKQASLQGRGFFGFYLIQNATSEEFLAQNRFNVFGNGPLAFFSFSAANPDFIEHFRFLGDNRVAVEDLFGGGDFDFDDLVFRFEFGETDAPQITAQLLNDTAQDGQTNNDRITSDPTIIGTITDVSSIVSLRAGFDNTPISQFVDILDTLLPNGQFILDRDRINQIAGGTLNDGLHVLRLQVEDANGNVAPIFNFNFTMDSMVNPAPTLILDRNTDSGTVGDNITNFAEITLSGQTEANARVRLVQTNATTQADSQGNFSFEGIAINEGDNTFQIEVTDTAGNTANRSVTITRQNVAPTVANAIEDQDITLGGMFDLIDLAGVFTDADINNSLVRFHTNQGDFDLELFDTAAPRTVANFFNYILRENVGNFRNYNNSIFHRSDPDFVLQGGGFTFVDGTPPTLQNIAEDPPVQNEFNQMNAVGTVAMAKLSGDPNSATSEFFINLRNNPNLDTQNGGFTVFGRVAGNGMQVINSIVTNLPPQNRGGVFDEIPLDPGTNVTNFPDNTTADDYALIETIEIVRRVEELTYTVTNNSNPGLVTATITNNRLQLTPVAGQTGTAEITVRATDRAGAFVEETFTVTVNPAP